jgi:hypothetical protein
MTTQAVRQPSDTVVWIKYPETTIGTSVNASPMPVRRPCRIPFFQCIQACRYQICPATKTSSGATSTCRCCTAGWNGWFTTANGSRGWST